MNPAQRARRLLLKGHPIVPRVAVGYPAGGSVTVPWAKSMMSLLAEQMKRADQVRHLQRIIPSSGLYVSRNRNQIVRAFLKDGNEEYLLQIDTDIEFKPDVLPRLLELARDGRDIVAVNIRLGSAKHSGYEESGEFLYRPMATLPEGDVIPVDAAATAMMMVHRKVFEKIAEEAGPCWFNILPIPYETDTEGAPWAGKEWEEIGEDLAFCSRAKRVGFQTYLARGFGLRHHKVVALEEVFE